MNNRPGNRIWYVSGSKEKIGREKEQILVRATTQRKNLKQKNSYAGSGFTKISDIKRSR